jgi:hypothetical protein
MVRKGIGEFMTVTTCDFCGGEIKTPPITEKAKVLYNRLKTVRAFIELSVEFQSLQQEVMMPEQNAHICKNCVISALSGFETL